jgi:type IV secretion system protein VirB9
MSPMQCLPRDRVRQRRALRILAIALACATAALRAAEPGDARIRTSVYAADEVYRLPGYVGFQIDLEFERGESFVGLGAGDVESLAFAAQDNHLFLKPRAAGVDTNLTVLTNRRTYHFEYRTSARAPDATLGDVIYVLRFVYAVPPAAEAVTDGVNRRLAQAAAARAHNLDYAYCGSPGLKPEAAWDDGVQTHVRFGARQELPALFVQNEDGSEALVNFSIETGEVVVHRVARRFVVRRGRLTGCIVNQRFAGEGEELGSGTVTPAVRRVTREASP